MGGGAGAIWAIVQTGRVYWQLIEIQSNPGHLCMFVYMYYMYVLQESRIESIQLQLSFGLVCRMVAQKVVERRRSTLRCSGKGTWCANQGSAPQRVQMQQWQQRGMPGRWLLSAGLYLHRHSGAMFAQSVEGNTTWHSSGDIWTISGIEWDWADTLRTHTTLACPDQTVSEHTFSTTCDSL